MNTVSFIVASATLETMKSNNLIFSLSVLGLVALFLALRNADQLDTLTETIDQIQQNIAHRGIRGLAGVNNTIILADLLKLVNTSGLQGEYLKFVIDFLHLHMYNLPSESELQQLIEVVKEIQDKNLGSSLSGSSGDFLSKFSKGPGSSGVGGGATV